MHAAGLDRIVVEFILLPSPHLAPTCHMQAGASAPAAEQQWLRGLSGAQSST